MTTITKISFLKCGSIQVVFPLAERPSYIVTWGRVSLRPEQAEEAADCHGWKNLGSDSEPGILAQGLIEVERGMLTYMKRFQEAHGTLPITGIRATQ